MADGISASVTVKPSSGTRTRGIAAGLGAATSPLEITRPELFDEYFFSNQP